MGVPALEVGYTAAMPRREDHEVHKEMWWYWTKKNINETCIFWEDFRKKKSPIPNFMIIRSVGAERTGTDRRTDMTKLTVVFRSFTNALNNRLLTIRVEAVFSVKLEMKLARKRFFHKKKPQNMG